MSYAILLRSILPVIFLVVQCGAPPIPTNGMVVVSSETFGSTITHTCNTGFLLCGDINRTCQSNGSWSGSTPDCISKF